MLFYFERDVISEVIQDVWFDKSVEGREIEKSVRLLKKAH